MSVLVHALSISSLILGAFFVFLPKRRQAFAEVFSLSVLALVVCSGFRSLSADPETATRRSPSEIAANTTPRGN